MREIQNVIGRIIGQPSEQETPRVVYVITTEVPQTRALPAAPRSEDKSSKMIKMLAILVMGVIGMGVLGVLAGIDSGEPRPLRTTNPGMVYTDCGWKAPVRDVDGRWMTPYDANGNGVIECRSDIEMGA